ncbi:hypothetical protein BE04_29230 [Sorangium cellulosum]|uniref:N-acetyltransferase domain-containing protein n=2 Tax=Sorangium cellulosum TaxID=56 RepID=A0A150PGG3_SORCE|nr:hypothetical protein [Sorangium cellulosum]AGP40510.1 hypothetical protein SCE1572_42005 [Sorangium cellulosum So0157-2]KYF54744.1 hypothetical protein BE04_29230 [Sorangium cellulosum]
MAIEIRELRKGDKKVLKDFLNVVDTVYEGEPNYIRPLDLDISDRLDKKKNPFFEHAEGTAWMAYKDGRPAGRITAQVDHEHLRVHRDETGMFGFFDTIDDAETAQALLAEAAGWLRARGMKRMRGPYSLSINEEIGCLIEGFDRPAVLMMPYHRPHQGRLIEEAGFEKVKDLYAWRYEVGDIPARAQKAHAEILAMPEVHTRCGDPKNLLHDIRILMDVFNDAWSDNWGFVPMTEKELVKWAEDVRLILMPELTRYTFIDGEPAAVSLGLPDLNDLIKDFHGKLLPTGIFKLLWRLRVRGPKNGRLVVLGIRKKWRNVRRYAGLSAFLYVEMNRAAQLLGMTGGELGWTLEDNAAINAGIRLMGGRLYKKFRIYERAL